MLPAASATPTAVAKYFAAEKIVGFNLSQSQAAFSAQVRGDLFKIARSDVRRALKSGSLLMTGMKIGHVRVECTDTAKVVRVTYATGAVREIVTGTIAEVAPILAALYDVKIAAE